MLGEGRASICVKTPAPWVEAGGFEVSTGFGEGALVPSEVLAGEGQVEGAESFFVISGTVGLRPCFANAVSIRVDF